MYTCVSSCILSLSGKKKKGNQNCIKSFLLWVAVFGEVTLKKKNNFIVFQPNLHSFRKK